MIDLIKRLLLKDEQQTEDPQVNTAIAAAALTFEVVWADHEIGEQEMRSMAALLHDIFNIEHTKIEEIIGLTQENHRSSVGIFPFTRALNTQLEQNEKYLVVKALWTIAYADAQIDAFEEHTIRRIADLLYVPHQRFIEAKLAARNP